MDGVFFYILGIMTVLFVLVVVVIIKMYFLLKNFLNIIVKDLSKED